jgi:hypothetical protein
MNAAASHSGRVQKSPAFDGGADLAGVTLDTGEQIPADLALVGLGIKPASLVCRAMTTGA